MFRSEDHLKFSVNQTLLHPAQVTSHSYFARAQSRLFSSKCDVGKLGNELAQLRSPWCYFTLPENNCATDQKNPGLKSVVRCTLFIMLF